MKRFTATEKWFDPWFRKLSPHLKLLWLYVCDNCDHAGVWNPDLELAASMIGSGKFLEKDCLDQFDGRIIVIGNSRWLIRKFTTFQYGELNPDNRCHKSAIRRLTELGINPQTLAPSKGLVSPLEGDKDKDKDKVQDREGGTGGNRNGRLYGIPASVEEVIAYGASLYPKIGEQICRDFWAHYEGQKGIGPSGDEFWKTSGDAVITNWKVKLPSFRSTSTSYGTKNAVNKPNPRNTSMAPSPTDYGEAFKRKAAKQDLERKMAESENRPSSQDSRNGTGSG